MVRKHYEKDEKRFSERAYQMREWKGIAWYVLGWETEPDEDTEWSGMENRTGKVIVVMVGDDRLYSVEEEDLIPLAEGEYCMECGQVGCLHGR